MSRRRRITHIELPEAPVNRGLFITAMTLGAILIVVIMWCVIDPISQAV